jgi:hypothetical protein
MDHLRQDYFWYDRAGRVEHGIPVRDLLVFRLELAAAEGDDRRGARARGRRPR